MIRRSFFGTATLLALSLSIFPPGLARAETPALTEQESIRLALESPAWTGLIEGRREAARSEKTIAALMPNPVFEYGRETLDAGGGSTTESSYALSQRLDFAGRRKLARERAAVQADAAEAGIESQRAERVLEVRRGFFDTLHQQQHNEILARWAQRVATLETATRKREEAGDASGYERRRISREVAALSAERRGQEAALAAALERLRGTIAHDAAPSQAVLTGTMLPGDAPALAELLARVDRHPDLLRDQRQAAAHRLSRRLAERGRIPEVTVTLGLKTLDEDAGDGNGLLLGASVPLPVFDRGQGERQRAAAQEQVSQSEYVLTRARLHGEVRAAWQRFSRFREAAQAYRGEAVEPSVRLVSIAEAAYRGGEIGVLELVDAYRGALDAELNALALEHDARIARVELDELTGGQN